jgi:hypothetical protein
MPKLWIQVPRSCARDNAGRYIETSAYRYFEQKEGCSIGRFSQDAQAEPRRDEEGVCFAQRLQMLLRGREVAASDQYNWKVEAGGKMEGRI